MALNNKFVVKENYEIYVRENQMREIYHFSIIVI